MTLEGKRGWGRERMDLVNVAMQNTSRTFTSGYQLETLWVTSADNEPQAEVTCRGHADEARTRAERPVRPLFFETQSPPRGPVNADARAKAPHKSRPDPQNVGLNEHAFFVPHSGSSSAARSKSVKY